MKTEETSAMLFHLVAMPITMLLSLKEIDLLIIEEPKMLKCMRNLRQSSNCSQLTMNKKRKIEREISWYKLNRNKNNQSRKLKTRRRIILCCNIKCWVSVMKIWFRRFTTLMRINSTMICIPRCREKQKIHLIIVSTKELLHLLHLQKEFCWVIQPINRTYLLSKPNLTFWNSTVLIKVQGH